MRRLGGSPWLAGASGAAGLGYQVVWLQQCALWVGHEAAAALAVVAALFGGLAAGSAWLAPGIERSMRPAQWYAGCEAMIGAWALVLVVAMAPASGVVLAVVGQASGPAWQWGVTFLATFLMLLPATAAMGATLPAIERACRLRGGAMQTLPLHYAANTLGAVVGVCATAFWLVPTFGLAMAAATCASVNLACAALAPAWLGVASAEAPPASLPRADAVTRAAVAARMAATGLLGIGCELAVIRVVSQVAEDTVYTYAALLVVFLAGTALGAALYQRRRPASDATGSLLVAVATCTLGGTVVLHGAEWLRTGVIEAGGGTVAAAVGAEALLGVLALAAPAMAMGALFSNLIVDAGGRGVPYSSALAWNTLGAALAPLVFGVVLLPALGAQGVLLAIVAAYLLLVPHTAWRRMAWIGTLSATAALAMFAPGLVFVDLPPGGRTVYYADGVMAAVSVVEDGQGVARLRIDNREQEGSSASAFVDGRQALLPLLLHPAPRRALFLGLGTGVTARTALLDPALEVEAAELVPEVVTAAGLFTAGPARSLHVQVADARRHVRTTATHYDVIVADNFHPARNGSGALYTVEHFAAIRERLSADGVFCQWLPLHQLDLATLKVIVASFLAVYPHGVALLASNSLQTPVIGLVAHAGDKPLAMQDIEGRIDAARRWPQPLSDYGLRDAYAVAGSLVAGPSALRRFAAGADLNTDDHPVVAYLAPRVTYSPDSRPAERLMSWLKALGPSDDLAIEGRPESLQRLARYREARNRYLAVGMAVSPSEDVRRMVAQVAPALLDVLRISPDFEPARDPLMRMAGALQATDLVGAADLRTRVTALTAGSSRRHRRRSRARLPCARPAS